jgi:DNA-directed RNA polymerase subunit RPC12/RpoP
MNIFKYFRKEKSYYKIEVICTNCNAHFDIKISRGLVKTGQSVTCRNCGHKGLTHTGSSLGGNILDYF